MRDMQGQINEWISRNRQNLIRCPHQPGNLLITKWSCRIRRLKAEKADLANVMSGDVMDYVHRQGLSICLTCDALKKDGRCVKPLLHPGFLRQQGPDATGPLSSRSY